MKISTGFASLLICISFASPSFASSSIKGRWKVLCSPDYLGGGSLAGRLEYSEWTSWEKYTIYQRSNCLAPDVTIERIFGYRRPQNGNFLDLTTIKDTVTPRSQEAVDRYNQRLYCGLDTWTIDKTVDRTYLPCGFNFGIARYQIAEVVNDVLFFGKQTPEKDMTTPAKRPTEFFRDRQIVRD